MPAVQVSHFAPKLHLGAKKCATSDDIATWYQTLKPTTTTTNITTTATSNRYIQDYLVQPLLEDLSSSVFWGEKDGEPHVLRVDEVSTIHWPDRRYETSCYDSYGKDCFVWSMDSRLHRFFCRSFCVRNIAEQIKSFVSNSSSKKNINMRALSNAVASLTEYFCTPSKSVNVYFVEDHGHISMILPSHEEVFFFCVCVFVWRVCCNLLAKLTCPWQSLSYLHLFPDIRHEGMELALAVVSRSIPCILHASIDGERFCDTCILGGDDEHSAGVEFCADVNEDDGRTCHIGPRWEQEGLCGNEDMVDLEPQAEEGRETTPLVIMPLFKLPHTATSRNVNWKKMLIQAERFAFSGGECAISFHGGRRVMLDHAQQYAQWVKFAAMKKTEYVQLAEEQEREEDYLLRRSKRARVDCSCDGSEFVDSGHRESWICVKLAEQSSPFVDKKYY